MRFTYPFSNQKNLQFLEHKTADIISLSPFELKNNENEEALDLQEFKYQSEKEGRAFIHLPYTSMKSSITAYKVIFVSLGLLFSCLSLWVFFNNPAWTCSELFVNCEFVKTLLEGITGSLAAMCLWLGFSLRIENDILSKSFLHTKRKLMNIYHRKHPGFNLLTLLYFKQKRELIIPLRHAYQDVIECLERHKEETEILLKQIGSTKFQDTSSKEKLYNQALADFKIKTDHLIKTFSGLRF